ncbi:hypothetical protein BGZ60DRAFT_522910 [Tricladium varicosporioides]|nr:hypothetical protein BGZ60DRAFT_522910 [Hymenoscyphus varicosporioides]
MCITTYAHNANCACICIRNFICAKHIDYTRKQIDNAHCSNAVTRHVEIISGGCIPTSSRARRCVRKVSSAPCSIYPTDSSRKLKWKPANLFAQTSNDYVFERADINSQDRLFVEDGVSYLDHHAPAPKISCFDGEFRKHHYCGMGKGFYDAWKHLGANGQEIKRNKGEEDDPDLTEDEEEMANNLEEVLKNEGPEITIEEVQEEIEMLDISG